jgi:cytochrome P450
MRLDEIPAVSGATGLGYLRAVRDDPFGFFERLSRDCGDIGRASVLGIPLIFANSPALLHEVLVQNAKSFMKSPVLRGALRPLAGEGLFTGDGPQWMRRRKLMAPLFTQGKVAEFVPVIAQFAQQAAADLRAEDRIDAARLTTRIAMRIAGKTLFDVDTLSESDELGAALTVALKWVSEQSTSLTYAAQLRLSTALRSLSDRLPGPLRARGMKVAEDLVEPIRWPGGTSRAIEDALGVIERAVQQMIEDRRASKNARNDLMSLLLTARDEEGGLTDKQVRDEIVTLFVAAHETTATALAWSLYLLARHPEAHARAAAEARRLCGRAATAKDLPALAYCSRVFKEAMRLYPPVHFFGRQATADVRLGGYELPRGTIVLISLFAMQRRPELWPDPLKFDPDRFTPENEEARHKLAWAPFGAGPRTCLGNHFAMFEGPVVLATLLDRVDLALATAAEISPDHTTATLRPRGGVPMRVTAARAGAGPGACSPRPAGAPNAVAS